MLLGVHAHRHADKCALDLLALCNCLDTATQKWQRALSAAVATEAQPLHLCVCLSVYVCVCKGRKRGKKWTVNFVAAPNMGISPIPQTLLNEALVLCCVIFCSFSHFLCYLLLSIAVNASLSTTISEHCLFVFKQRWKSWLRYFSEKPNVGLNQCNHIVIQRLAQKAVV